MDGGLGQRDGVCAQVASTGSSADDVGLSRLDHEAKTAAAQVATAIVATPLDPAAEGLPAAGLALWLRADRGIYEAGASGVRVA